MLIRSIGHEAVASALTLLLGLLLSQQAALADDLQQELIEVVNPVYEDNLPRDAVLERLEKFEQKCKAMLERYKTQEEQGRIYAWLARNYAQTGQLVPEKTAAYAEKAIALQTESLPKMLLYIYWGSSFPAARGGASGEELAAERKKAAMPYLLALRETISQNLPEQKPELPGVGKFDADPRSEAGQRLRARHDAQVEARKLAEFQRDMIDLRETITGQIASLYSRRPLANDELVKLARDVLGDSSAVDRLMARVKASIQEQGKAAGEHQTSRPAAKPALLLPGATRPGPGGVPTSNPAVASRPGEP